MKRQENEHVCIDQSDLKIKNLNLWILVLGV